MGSISALGPSIPVAEIAATVSHGVTRAYTSVAAGLQGIREPDLQMEPLVTTSHGESWSPPAPGRAREGLVVLLLTPDLHPHLQSTLQARVMAHLQALPHTAGQPPGVIEAMAMTLHSGRPLEEAYGSLTPAQRDAVWQAGPYRDGDPASDLLLNYLALIQGKVIEMEVNSRQYGCTDHRQLPALFDPKQASLEDWLRQVETSASASGKLIPYHQLNQRLYLQEWLVQLPVGMAQHIGHWLLHCSLPSTAVARQLRNYCQGPISAQALGEHWPSIWSQLQQASTVSEFLEGVNQALEQGVQTPVAVFYGLSNLCGMATPLIPVSLIAAAALDWGQEKFAGWLRDYVGSPSSEATRTLQELSRLASNCASLKQYTQPALGSLDDWLHHASVPPEITHAVDNPGARARSNTDKHWLEQGGIRRRGHDLTPGVTEPPATSAVTRPTGILQAVQYAARHVVSATVSLLCKTSSPDVHEKTDVETPLYPDPSAVYQPTTAPVAAEGRHWPAVGTGLGIGAASVALVTGANALYQSMTGGPDLISPASEPGFAPLPPPVQTLLDELKNHWHLTPEGELMSTWDALMAMRAAPDAHARQARVSALLHQDFGESLARLVELATPTVDADFDEFDALEKHAPVRQRRAAGTGPQTAERVLAEDVIALLDQASAGAQQQDQWLQQAVLGDLLSRLPAGHWLHNASAGEQALWMTTAQTLTGYYQRLADLKYDSLAQFEAQRPALQQAMAEINQSELQLAVLKSRLKGDLSPGSSYMGGLAVMMAALNNEPQVVVGSLQLSIGEGGDAVSVPLAQWQLFVRRDARGEEDGVVLYRPAEHRVQAFSSQQEMFQYLDLKRMRQSLYAEVRPPATPGPVRSASPMGLPTQRQLPELALKAAPPAQRRALQRSFATLGQRPDQWTPEHLQVHTYPGASLQDKLRGWAGARLVSEQARLQRLAANPDLAAQTAALALTQQQVTAFVDEFVPPLRTFTRRTESKAVTELLQDKGGLATNVTVDADAVLITFNGQTLSWTDWVLEGYRKHGDNVFGASNNFLADARFEHDDPAVVRALGTPGLNQDVQQRFRGTYTGDQYLKGLEQWLGPDNTIGQRLRELNVQLYQQQIQVAVAQARLDDLLDPYTAQAFKALVDGVLTSTVTAQAILQAFQVNGRRIPEVLVLSLRQRATAQRFSAALRSDYVCLLGPYGLELHKLSDYLQLIRTPGLYYDDLQARALIRDKQIVEAFQRGQRDTGEPSVPIDDFSWHVGTQWLQDGIDNVREATTSRKEMITEQAFKGLRGAAGGICIASSMGTAAVPCAALTLGLMGHDVGSALHHLERGRLDDALMDVAFLGLDALDVGGGLAASRLTRLLNWAGKSHFSSATEVHETARAMAQQHNTAFTTGGRLNEILARKDLTASHLSMLPQRPGKAPAGTFYSHDGEHYIQDRYQDQVQVYEVYSDNAWATVRVRDPQRPQGQGAPVRYHDGHWRADEGGLLGGGKKQSKVKVADTAPDAPPQSLTVENYEMPAESISTLHALLVDKHGLHEDYGTEKVKEEAVRTQFFKLRRQVQQDAEAIMSIELPPRPTLPAIPSQTSLADFLQKLYDHTHGVVIGETHHSVASKKFIIDNMSWLGQHDVKTLYMEHLLSDMHPVDLEGFFKNGRMSDSLRGYLKMQDKGHRTDPAGIYTFEKLVFEAQKNGIEVRAIDCAASYRLEGFPGQKPTSRQRMMNYVASRIIQKHQAVAGHHRWIALVGNSHSNTYQNVPGVAELNGGIGVRVTDVQSGMESSPAYDTGELLSVATGGSRKEILLEGDYLLQLATAPSNALRQAQSAQSIEQKLAYAGQFLIEQGQDGKQVIVHRSRDQQIYRTPVMLDAQGRYYVSRATWNSANGQRYDSLDALIRALKEFKMEHIQ
ncbi:membrane-targeted effector domain-containing toxin [Pseudomonas gregormendelii]